MTGKVSSERCIRNHLTSDSGFDTRLQIDKKHVDTDVSWGVPRPLGGVGHHEPVQLAEDRRDVGACVGDDPYARCFERLGDPLVLDLAAHPPAGIHIKRRGGMDPAPREQSGEGVKLRELEMRSSDAHRGQCAARTSTQLCPGAPKVLDGDPVHRLRWAPPESLR